MMFGLRQALRTSLRLLPIKSLEKSNFPQTAFKALRRCSTQLNDNPQTQEETLTRHPVAKVEAKMRIMFTCKKCDTRNSKTMTKLAYMKGVVIIRCDGCKNNHLIADNLGWFGPVESKRNIEKLMKLKGDTVRRLQVYGSDTFEVVSKDEKSEIKDEKNEIKEIESDAIRL